MAQRPTETDLCGWIGIDVPTPASQDDVNLKLCLNVSLEHLEDLVNPTLLTTKGFSLAVGTTTYPYRLFLAVLLLGHRLYKRRTSPEGVAGFGDHGVVRVLPTDVDIENMLDSFTIDGFA